MIKYGYLNMSKLEKTRFNFKNASVLNTAYKYLKDNNALDMLLYDATKKKPNNQYETYLDMLLDICKEDSTIVVLSLFHLGRNDMAIYQTLGVLKEKHIKLIVDKWEVDISSTMKKVLELSVEQLAIYENIQLYKCGCYSKANDYVDYNNLDYLSTIDSYRKLAGYNLNSISIRYETVDKIRELRHGKPEKVKSFPINSTEFYYKNYAGKTNCYFECYERMWF